MAHKPRIKNSLFDDIFRLQNTAPEVEVDPEDVVDGSKPALVDDVDEIETFDSSSLRKQTAVILDDPKYRGKKTSRKNLYSDEDDDDYEEDSNLSSLSDDEPTGNAEPKDDDTDDFDEPDESDNDKTVGSDVSDENDDDDGSGDGDMEDDELRTDKDETVSDLKVLPVASKSDDRVKGKAVTFQLGVWDNLMKSRISLQKLLTACNRLPPPDTWPSFAQHDVFRKEAKNVHSSVRKLVSALLDLQLQLSAPPRDKSGKVKPQADDSDEEITSESEGEQDQGVTKGKSHKKVDEDKEEEKDSLKDDDSGVDEGDEEMEIEEAGRQRPQPKRLKRKLDVEEIEETLMKRHKDHQSFRNSTLTKWDEKTRLIRGKIKAKNFAAFEVSVLKQIEQILMNRERLVRRLHLYRSPHRILGQPTREVNGEAVENNMVEDDDEDVEIKLKQQTKQEAEINEEVIDDNDFYHICLRDHIEAKQNDETDPVVASKQWLEIQRLRNKQKRKVDTRASKGRKIRYHVKEKLKNFMTPYDKSTWTDEQKDDLFKALFGGSQHQDKSNTSDKLTINLGI